MPAGTLNRMIAFAIPTFAAAATLDVPRDHPRIQDAIDASSAGDTVLVHPGTYLENLDFGGRAITVTGTAPSDSAVVAATVVDAAGTGPVVTFANGEGGASVLAGLRLTGGQGSFGGGVVCMATSPRLVYCTIDRNRAHEHGGGVYCWNASPNFESCRIADNFADGTGLSSGGGAYCAGNSSPRFELSTIGVNRARRDGGALACADSSFAALDRCLLLRNWAEQDGGAIFAGGKSACSLEECTLQRNRADSDGGALHASDTAILTLSFTTITDSRAYDDGGALYAKAESIVSFTNCTLTRNWAGDSGGAVYGRTTGSLAIDKSVLWENLPAEIFVQAGSVDVSGSDVQGGWPGEDNFDDDPLFCDGGCRGEDLALGDDSPCLLDGGELVGAAGAGCDTPRANSPLQWRVPEEQPTIREAFRVACTGDTILLSPGIYDEHGLFLRRHSIHLLGTDPFDSTTVAATAVDGGGAGRVFEFVGPGTAETLISGITVQHGHDLRGGGIRCLDGASITIDRCRVAANTAQGGGGIDITNASPTIANSRFEDNYASFWAGAIGAIGSSPTIAKCRFVRNSSYADAGGALVFHQSNGVVSHCVLRDNVSFNSGAIEIVNGSNPLISNCLMFDNYGDDGGAMRISQASSPIINNCTIADNSAIRGGGIRVNGESAPRLTNCILWGNSPESIYDLPQGATLRYSDVEGGWPGVANIDVDPLFMTYRYLTHVPAPGSPCIDAGNPALSDELYDAHPRWPAGYRNRSRSDMGAYGGPRNALWIED